VGARRTVQRWHELRWPLADACSCTRYVTPSDERDETSQLLCASIQSFKGMESDVVFVTEMAKVHPDQAIQMSFTAAHARHHLCIFDLCAHQTQPATT
jgi:hypothetical protein